MSRPVRLLSTNALFARNVIWMTVGFGIRLGIQVVYFLVVARTLKPDAYGSFSGALALVTVLSPFATWGSGNILVKNVSRHPKAFPTFWGAALSTSVASGVLLCGMAVAVGYVVLSPIVAWRLVLPIAIGDLLGTRLADLSGQAFQAFQRLSRTSLIWVTFSACRLGSALLLLLLPLAKTAENWAVLYMISGLLAGSTGLLWVHRELGWGPLSFSGMRGEWREGFYFAVGLSAQGAYNDIDKALLLRMTSEAVSGAYTAAYRVLDAVFIPVRALLSAGYPRFFQAGERSLTQATLFALRLLPWVIGWSMLAGLGLVLMVPWLPLILGREYHETPAMVVWLTPILLLRGFHYLAADVLTGAGFQGLRSFVQIGVALLNVALNLRWIPKLGWMGAVWSSLAADGVLVIGLWSAIGFLQRRLNRTVTRL